MELVFLSGPTFSTVVRTKQNDIDISSGADGVDDCDDLMNTKNMIQVGNNFFDLKRSRNETQPTKN